MTDVNGLWNGLWNALSSGPLNGLCTADGHGRGIALDRPASVLSSDYFDAYDPVNDPSIVNGTWAIHQLRNPRTQAAAACLDTCTWVASSAPRTHTASACTAAHAHRMVNGVLEVGDVLHDDARTGKKVHRVGDHPESRRKHASDRRYIRSLNDCARARMISQVHFADAVRRHIVP